MIAIPVQDATPTAVKTNLNAAFGIELDQFKAVSSTIGHKRNIVRFGHRMVKGDKIFIFDFVTVDAVVAVGLLHF